MNLPTFKQNPEFIRATFHINTPMFVAGADNKQNDLPEFTPTAFKGVLRFWWRALNWSKIFLANNCNKVLALQALHEQEAKLFGLASKDDKGGQGDCLINAFHFTPEKPREWQLPTNKNGVNYLLGQGLYKYGVGLTRRAFAEKQSFTIDLTVKNGKDEIIDVLKLIGLLGSFGSRSRHGFGSVTLTKLEAKSLTSDYQNIEIDNNAKTAIEGLLTKYQCRKNDKLPPLSAFYKGTRIDIIKLNKSNSIDVLNDIGEEQQMYRSFGKNGKVGAKNAERNFVADHDFVLNMIKGKNNAIKHPERVVFGLPHNYFYSGTNTSGHSGNIDASTGRRASPLILHIHQNGNTYQAIHCLFRSEFLPNGATVDIVARKGGDKKSQKVPENVDYQVIETFMNRFANKETVQ